MKSYFSQDLLQWYKINARDLPWRSTKDPYKIWVSEAMLQQTTVKTVLGFYPLWLKQFPHVRALAKAPLDQVLKAWQGLGYYNRARNFHKAAQIVVEQFGAMLPSDPKMLRALPGFGPYMSASVASIAFDVKVPLVDANVRRVVMRILNIHGHADTSHDDKIIKFLDSALPDRNCGDFNQALMELGALVCSPKEPTCNLCPVSRHCQAYAKGCQELIPEPKKVKLNNITAVIALIRRGGKYLIQQRPEKGLLAGFWEFPGGKVEPSDKSMKAALVREIKEELGVDCRVADEFCRVRHYYTTNKVLLIAYEVELEGKTLKLQAHQRWAGLKDLHRYAMPSGSAKIVEKLSM